MADPATRNRDAERRTAQLLRAAVLAWYSPAWPPACACCAAGTGQLGIDHINGDGPAQRAAAWGHPGRAGYNPARLYRWLIEHGFPPGFQVMCKPCNSSKNDGGRCRLYHGPALGEHQKWCAGCLRIRDRRTDFNKESRRPDGLNIQCRDCTTATMARWRERHDTHRSVSTREGTIGGRALAYLSEHDTASTADLARFLGITPAAVAVNLGGLVREGHACRPARGVFCLPGREGAVARVRHVYERGPDWAARHAGEKTAGKGWTAGMTWRAEVTRGDDMYRRGLR